MSEESDDPEVRLGYSSDHNISFKGSWETGYTRSEWDKLTEARKDEIREEAIWDLVDLWVMDDDEEEPW